MLHSKLNVMERNFIINIMATCVKRRGKSQQIYLLLEVSAGVGSA